ncbi:MAG: CDC27 family protein [Sulfuricurvum sp.]|nr:CDC27 family protein [Sulfuricurvum sp.]
MLDISKLERRWLKYKIKKILPYTLLITTVTILGFTIPFVLSNRHSSKAMIPLKKDAIKVKAPNTENDEGAMVLEPSMHFIESMDTPSTPITNTPTSSTKPAPTPKHSIAPIASLPTPTPAIAQTQATKAPQPIVKGKLTSIKRDDTAFDIHEIEDRFKDTSNPNLGVYIAKYHYDHGNYSEAYNYALKTNSINNSIDDSWLIFAKALVKLGKEEQAKKTLQLYISNSNSQAAKNYLDTLDKGGSK